MDVFRRNLLQPAAPRSLVPSRTGAASQVLTPEVQRIPVGRSVSYVGNRKGLQGARIWSKRSPVAVTGSFGNFCLLVSYIPLGRCSGPCTRTQACIWRHTHRSYCLLRLKSFASIAAALCHRVLLQPCSQSWCNAMLRLLVLIASALAAPKKLSSDAASKQLGVATSQGHEMSN